MSTRAIVCALMAVLIGGSSASYAQVKTDWLTYGFDAVRSSDNRNEYALGIANVNRLALAWSFQPGPFELAINPVFNPNNASMAGQPVLASGVVVNGTATDLLIVADQNNFVFALDANSTKPGGTVVWYRSLDRGTPVLCKGVPSVPGIGAAATIDRGSNGGKGAVYIGNNNLLYALDLATGTTLAGWPVSMPELGSITTDGYIGPAANIVGDEVYVGTATNCGKYPHYGRVVRINIPTAAVDGVWYSMTGTSTRPTGQGSSGSGGSVWGPGGVAIDPTAKVGGVYVATANADVKLGQPGQVVFAEDIVNLNPDLTVMAGAASPPLPSGDWDYGATPVVFRPAGCPTKLLAVPNKIGFLAVESIAADGTLAIWQQLNMAANTGAFRNGVAWDSTTDQLLLTTPTNGPAPFRQGLSALQFDASCTTLSLAWQVNPVTGPNRADPLSPPTIANQLAYIGVAGMHNSQVLAVALAAGNGGIVPGQVVWQSPELINVIIKAPPIVANGRLYVSSIGNGAQVAAFALPAP